MEKFPWCGQCSYGDKLVQRRDVRQSVILETFFALSAIYSFPKTYLGGIFFKTNDNMFLSFERVANFTKNIHYIYLKKLH